MPHRPLALVLPLLLALACSTEPVDQTIPAEPSTWRTDAEFQKAVTALPPADEKLLQGWMMRYAFKAGKGEPVPRKTIGEAIEEQRAFVAQRKQSEAAGGEATPSSEAPASAPAP